MQMPRRSTWRRGSAGTANPIPSTRMPSRCAARNNSTVSAGLACQDRASASGRMARSATIGACSRKSASFGASPWLAGSRSSSAISAVKAAAHGGLGRLFGARAGNVVGTSRLGDQLFDHGEPLVAFAVDLAGHLRQPSQHADALDLRRKHQPAAGAVGIEVDDGLEAAERAVAEIARPGRCAVFLPLAVAVLPAQPQRADARRWRGGGCGLGVGAFLDPVDRRAGQFVDARGIGDERPNRFRRLGVMPFLAVAIEDFHRRFPTACSLRRATRASPIIRANGDTVS